MTSDSFKSWTTEALHGYVVMLEQFVNASHEEIAQKYVARLKHARDALLERASEAEGKKSSVIFRETIKNENNEVKIKENEQK